MKRQLVIVLVAVMLLLFCADKTTWASPSYYTCEGSVSHFSVSPSGSTEILTQQGIDIGVNLSFTILIDFSREGEYIRNNGDVWIQPEGLYTFYADKVSFDIGVTQVNGKLPTEKQLADISTYLRTQERPHERTFVCFYLPGMEVGAGAWATAHFKPNLKVWISNTNKVTANDSKTLGILADRYSDGNISLVFFSYDLRGEWSWVGDGVLMLSIKDNNGKTIKVWERNINRQGASFEIYMGSAIGLVRSMDAIYTCEDGNVYSQGAISLKRLLD